MKKAARALPGNEAASQLPQQADHTPPGPFGQWAKYLAEAGFTPIAWHHYEKSPGNFTKKPCLEKKWWNTVIDIARHGAHTKSGTNFWRKCQSNNVGVLCGEQGGLVAIDIDEKNPDLLKRALSHFGDTPIITQTAKGYHLWYRWNGEIRRTRLFGEVVPIDLLGTGGWLAVPPSRRRDGSEYWFCKGSFKEVRHLPQILPGALEAFEGHTAQHDPYGRQATPKTAKLGKAPSPRPPAAQPTTSMPAADGKIHEGQRDDTIIKKALHIASDVHRRGGNQAEVLAALAAFNRDNCVPPLEQAIIDEKAARAWEMTLDGKNYFGQGDPWHELNKLIRGGARSDDVVLHIVLKNAHRKRNNFALVPEAMAKAQLIPGWPEARYRRSIKRQEKSGWLECIHRGGRGPKDPSLFRICAKGTKSVPNLNLHPSSGASLGSSEAFFMDAVEFGQLMRRLRVERGMTVKQLAARVGLVRQTLSDIEAGRYPTTEDRQQAILAALEAKTDEAAA